MAQKVVFDPTLKYIHVNSGELSLDIRQDLYSDAKEDWLVDSELRKYAFPFRVSGGDPTVAGQIIEPYFFLQEGWKIKPYEADHTLTLIGNIFTEEGDNPSVPTSGEYTVFVTQLTTITRVEGGQGALTQEQYDQLMSLPDLTEIETSSVLAKESTVSSKPSLAQIEASTTLAKENSVTARPTLSQIEASTILAKQADLLRALGLMQENYYLDQATYETYQGQTLLTSARMRTYSVAGSVGTDNDVIGLYDINAGWNGAELVSYSVVKA